MNYLLDLQASISHLIGYLEDRRYELMEVRKEYFELF